MKDSSRYKEQDDVIMIHYQKHCCELSKDDTLLKTIIHLIMKLYIRGSSRCKGGGGELMTEPVARGVYGGSAPCIGKFCIQVLSSTSNNIVKYFFFSFLIMMVSLHNYFSGVFVVLLLLLLLFF